MRDIAFDFHRVKVPILVQCTERMGLMSPKTGKNGVDSSTKCNGVDCS